EVRANSRRVPITSNLLAYPTLQGHRQTRLGDFNLRVMSSDVSSGTVVYLYVSQRRILIIKRLGGMSTAWLMAEVVHYRSTPEVLAVWSINSGDILCLFMAPWMSWKAGGGQHELSLFLTLLASITILNRLPAFERRYGSWRCLASTLACLMAINGIFIGVMEASCLSSGISFDPYFGCNQYLWGMWPFAIFIVTRQCMDHPRGRVDFWGAWQISNKW
ncbi:hypothetical protein FOZ61_002319, partial [Perkinsus olseni]